LGRDRRGGVDTPGGQRRRLLVGWVDDRLHLVGTGQSGVLDRVRLIET
jgi:hypothetical protein